MSINIDEDKLRAALLPEAVIQSDLALVKIDLEQIWTKYGLTLGTDIYHHESTKFGMCYDPTNYCFYIIFNQYPDAENRKCLIIKLDEDGQVLATRYVADRCYRICVIANGGKLYAVESYHEIGDSLLDELSTADLSLVQNILTLTAADHARSLAVSKVSDTVLCLVGGGPGTASACDANYYKIDLVAKTYMKYTEGTGLIHACLKVGSYVYFDRYGVFQGNRKIDLTDWTNSAMGTPPSTTYGCDPIYELDGKVFCGPSTGGAGGTQAEQPSYWYTISSEAWAEISEYPVTSKAPTIGNAVLFPELKKSIHGVGATRYFNRPACQFTFDPVTGKWSNITHLFDGVYSTPTVLNEAESTTSDITIKRLGSCVASAGGCKIGDTENFGMHPHGFFKDNYYRFLMLFAVRSFNAEERVKPVLVFGVLKP